MLKSHLTWPVAFLCVASLFSAKVALGQKEILENLGRMKSELIAESSGLALATIPDAFWTINDSGNRPELYLVANTGELLSTLSLKGAKNIDWESLTRLTIDGKPHLIVGDVGDNLRRRTSVALYLVPEPDFSRSAIPVNSSTRAVRLEFSYSDGPRDCEAIAAEPATDSIWLIEKMLVTDRNEQGPGIYRLPLVTKKQKTPLVAKRMESYPIRNVTGMDISSDGSKLIVRTYFQAHSFQLKDRSPVAPQLLSGKPRRISIPVQIQGEAICFCRDNQSVILTSERTAQPIWRLNLSAQNDNGNAAKNKSDSDR